MADWTQPITRNVGDLFTSTLWNTYIRDNTPYFDWKSTTKTVTSTTTETDLFNSEIVIPAAAMGSNQRLVGWADIDIKNNTGAAVNCPRFKLKLDSTVIFDTGALAGTPIATSATRGSGQIHFVIQEMNATNAQEATIFGWFVDGAKVNFTTGSGVVSIIGTSSGESFQGRNNTAVDMSSSRTLSLTVINPSSSGSYETVLYAARVAIGV